jgi:hypothetical protein
MQMNKFCKLAIDLSNFFNQNKIKSTITRHMDYTPHDSKKVGTLYHMNVYPVSQFCHFIKCHYPKCRYAECHGALIIDRDELQSKEPLLKGKAQYI